MIQIIKETKINGIWKLISTNNLTYIINDVILTIRNDDSKHVSGNIIYTDNDVFKRMNETQVNFNIKKQIKECYHFNKNNRMSITK